MKNILNKVFSNRANQVDILNEFITTQNEVDNLPPLSEVEKVQFDHDIAISHLYYSSKIEGSHLDDKRLSKAIHA